jgi:hypothetical protein
VNHIHHLLLEFHGAPISRLVWVRKLLTLGNLVRKKAREILPAALYSPVELGQI